MELEALQDKVDDIQAKGASIILISPQLPQYTLEMAEKHHLAMPVLNDPGNTIASRFGLVFRLPNDLKGLYQQFGIDLEKYNGDNSWSLPMPGRFILDQEGVVLNRDVHPDYTKRPDPEGILNYI
jgi:peroxiredoxin